MITKSVLNALYKKYSQRPASPDELNLSLLFEYLVENHHLTVDEHYIVIGSIDHLSPFHRIPLKNVHAIVEFADDIAIVLHSSIIILSKHNASSHINLKPLPTGWLSNLFRRH